MKEVERVRRRGGNCPAAPLAYCFKASPRSLLFGARLRVLSWSGAHVIHF